MDSAVLRWRASRGFLALSAIVVLILGSLPTAQASPPPTETDNDFFYAHHDEQHGGVGGHLPAGSSNVGLVAKLKLTSQVGDISDVSALQSSNDGKWYAYVGDWGAKCETGGVHVVDISDPSNPVKVGYLASKGFGYVTEGVHALHIDTSAYAGDILVISNEWCRASSNPKNNPGGITIFDITDPTNPTRLVESFGDDDALPGFPPPPFVHEAHSAIAWDAGDEAYVAAIDNWDAIDDVDIFEITDPSNPSIEAETGLGDWAFNQGASINSAAYGDFPTSHDLDVLQFPDGSWHLMVSYWDTGWVDVDVSDPANPLFVEDSDYAACDQVNPACPPEGNGHQGEWNAGGSLFIGTDEDQTASRTECSYDGTTFGCSEFGWTVPIATNFPTGFAGDIVWGGSGCPGVDLNSDGADDRTKIVSDFSQAGTGADAIAFHRGSCFFSDKVVTGEMAGYEMVVIINSHGGSLGGLTPNSFFAGGQGSPVLGTASGVMMGHANGHGLFNTPVNFAGAEGADFPALGTFGNPFAAEVGVFDGWGYSRLLDGATLAEIDQLPIAETNNPAFATGFGDLSVHEVEVPRGDPNEGGPNTDDGTLAYYAWYAGGFRVAEYDSTAITEVGHFVDAGGNQFWGVALAEDEDGNRIVLASDRDYGLYIFEYTGP